MPFRSELGRLLASFEQSFSEEDREICLEYSSNDEELGDENSEQSQDTDTELELSPNEEAEETVKPNSDQPQVTYTGIDGITKWSSKYHWTNVPTKSQDKIIDSPGVKPVACNVRTEIDCWKLFITNEMIAQILVYTNNEIKNRQSANKDQARVYLFNETTLDELLALFGLMYIAGLYRSSYPNVSDLWRNDGTGVEIFRTTMSLQRFWFLQRCLRFDDEKTREERKNLDNLAPLRSIFEEFVSNCQNNYSPSDYLTIDEKLVPFRGQCAFRTRIPNKPASYGIKMYTLVDAKVFYIINLEIHAGKQPEGPFLKSNKPFDVVDRLVQPISKTNRNVTISKKFTSVSLVTHLLNNHKLTSVGILNKNETTIPASFTNNRGSKENRYKFAFQKDMTLLSYKPKKSKALLVLSSLHHDQRIVSTTGNQQKPEILAFYDSTRSSVDVVAELCETYNVSRNSKQWTMAIFYDIMNIAAINSLIIYRESKEKNTNRREFVRKLGLALIEGYLIIRKNKDHLPVELRKRIHEQVGETTVFPAKSKMYKRCRDCPSVKDRKTKYTCNVCNKPICMEHVISFCQSCTNRD